MFLWPEIEYVPPKPYFWCLKPILHKFFMGFLSSPPAVWVPVVLSPGRYVLYISIHHIVLITSKIRHVKSQWVTHDFSIFSGLAVLSIYIYYSTPKCMVYNGKCIYKWMIFLVTPCYGPWLRKPPATKPGCWFYLPFQALLVLETDEDYVRFGIPQDRLSPILTVSSTGVQLTERQNLKLGPLPTPLSSQELEGFLVKDYVIT